MTESVTWHAQALEFLNLDFSPRCWLIAFLWCASRRATLLELDPNNQKCDVASVGIGVFELGFLVKMLAHCIFVVRLEAHHTFGI